jgi:hypothetical protein
MERLLYEVVVLQEELCVHEKSTACLGDLTLRHSLLRLMKQCMSPVPAATTATATPISLLLQCVRSLRYLISLYVTGDCDNYFGVFDEGLFAEEVELVAALLDVPSFLFPEKELFTRFISNNGGGAAGDSDDITNGLFCTSSSTNNRSSNSPFNGAAADDAAVDIMALFCSDNNNTNINNNSNSSNSSSLSLSLSSKLWWLRWCGLRDSVSWEDFRAAVTTCYSAVQLQADSYMVRSLKSKICTDYGTAVTVQSFSTFLMVSAIYVVSDDAAVDVVVDVQYAYMISSSSGAAATIAAILCALL